MPKSIDFMRELVASMLEHWVVQVLRAKPGGAFGEFTRIVIQDGSSFGLKETLSAIYPGRFKSKGPAAVELHVSMDLLEESLTQVVLTPDTFTERAELPSAEELRGSLLLATVESRRWLIFSARSMRCSGRRWPTSRSTTSWRNVSSAISCASWWRRCSSTGWCRCCGPSPAVRSGSSLALSSKTGARLVSRRRSRRSIRGDSRARGQRRWSCM